MPGDDDAVARPAGGRGTARERRFDEESPLARTRRARRMTRILAEVWPDAVTELDFTTPLELTVATILSAQSTDRAVNLVTPALFAAYPSAAAYAAADPEALERLVHSTGFFRSKAKALIGLGAALDERFGGAVPRTMDELVSLPGVGRKTANVILGEAFGLPGITVDTHVGRLVRRWRWSDETDPVKVETAVAGMIPARDWTALSQRTIWHGRRVCHARVPACGVCALAASCPSFGLGPVDPQVAARLVTGGSRA